MQCVRVVFAASVCAIAPMVPAQTPSSSAGERSAAYIPAKSRLPNAPEPSTSASREASPSSAGAAIRVPLLAPLYHKYIEPGQTAQPLGAADKVLFGVHQLMSPYLLLTMAAAAGYEQAANGSPNYGTDAGAYGQRLGAAALRDASQDILSDSVMAAALHEDPRYYVMGKRRNPGVRAAYSVSRVFVTRSDAGAAVPNYSLFSGYAGAAALENAYYPADNRGFSETAKSFAGSLGGAAFSNVVREFLPDLLRAARLER
jgi:hypothetical protein